MTSRRVLLVEDEPGLVMTLTDRLIAEGYEVESERGHDVRRDLARTVVTAGWGLVELRPLRMSLEQVFLELTTEDREPERSPEDQPNDDGLPEEHQMEVPRE